MLRPTQTTCRCSDKALTTILQNGGHVLRATKRYQWPNESAAVIVSIVHVGRGFTTIPAILDDRRVKRISSYLVAGDLDNSPARLISNEDRAFIGSYLLGMGFTFVDAAAAKGEAEPIGEMERLIAKDLRNAERIKP